MSGAALLAEVLYRPPIALGWVAVAVGLALLVAVLAMWRERSLWTLVLRGVGVAGLAWLLLGHSRTEPSSDSQHQPPRVTILVDTSASMAQIDSVRSADDPPISRLEAVRNAWLTSDRLDELSRVAQVQLIAFDEQARYAQPVALDARGKATRLLDVLGGVDADLTLILSDGHDTTSLSAQGFDAASLQAGRIFAVPVGTARSSPDLALQAWPDSDRLFEDQATTLTVSLAQSGLAGRPAVVELLHNGQVQERRPITLNTTSAEMAFQIKPQLTPGQTTEAHHYTARIALADGEEAYTQNNAEDVFIQVSRGRIKVLLLEGEPYWDTRSLARLIGSHPRFDLTAVFGFGQQRTTRQFGETIDPGADPTRDLSAFDIVVLGQSVDRLVEPGFDEQLGAFVRGGGAVVFARGKPFDEASGAGRVLLKGVEPISPVGWGQPVIGEMRVRLGEGSQTQGPLADLSDSAVLSRLPGMLAATRIEGRKAASLVLLEQQRRGDGTPIAALTTMRVGSGVVMAVLTEGLWRWELLPGVDDEDESLQSMFGVFWVRALQWLASGGAFLPGQDIALQADRLAIEPGQAVALSISTRYIETQGLQLQLTATDAQGNRQPIAMQQSTTVGGYTASFSPLKPGVYTFTLTAPGRPDLIDPLSPLTTRLSVVDRSVENRDTSARPELLKQLTEPTGGRCLTLDETRPIFDHLKTLQELRLAQPKVDYDFNSLAAFAWIAGCFGLEWILRRRSGLR